ncbi:solute carrier family 2, facilitated glucose transporter member 8-like [Plodia interpunctella]|uniref:solute carrier family 2, facilitated glucose transporter member 8-like n=1 Tax=Plodia interpunctella TaxID=58824 RepID=UPI002368DA45|nr:solute carrier family 2, facilitated glucose transporter member 8-like [Plodia interpunctella]
MHRNRLERSASKRWRGSVRRILSAAVYNLSCFTHGCSTGWVSGVLGNEALTGGAWLAALPCLVALPAAPFFAVLADAKGRKAGAFCISVSFIISWSLAAWCGPRGVWAARIAAGAGGAGALALAPVYCAEIAPRTRGLAAMPALACSSGILFAYGAGGMLSAHAVSLSMAVPPAVLLVSLLWLQETPSFLISIGRMQDAAKVICWFDGSDFQEDLTDVIEQQEVRIRTSEYYGRREGIRRQDSDAFQPMLKRSSGLDSNCDRRSETSACRDLFRHRRSRRALVSCVVLFCAAAGSGVGAVNSFAAAVLRHSTHDVPHLNLTVYNFTLYNGTVPRRLFDTSEAGSIMCGTALVLGAAVATVTVDKIGRKILLLWSCSGITCCLALLGVYCDPRLRMQSWYINRLWPYRKLIHDDGFHQKIINVPQNIVDLPQNTSLLYEELILKNYTKSWLNVNESLTEVPPKVLNLTTNDDTTLWAPVTLLSVTMFLYNIGLGSVPFVLISELFSINARSLASSLLISWMWLSSFLLLRYYGTIAVSLGLHGTYYISASITLLGSLYTFFIIPETKGRTQEEIDQALDGPLLVMEKNER